MKKFLNICESAKWQSHNTQSKRVRRNFVRRLLLFILDDYDAKYGGRF